MTKLLKYYDARKYTKLKILKVVVVNQEIQKMTPHQDKVGYSKMAEVLTDFVQNAKNALKFLGYNTKKAS